MALEDIRIKISSDTKDLQPTIDKLKELGVVDKKNAEQFQITQKEYETASKARLAAIEKEKSELAALIRLRQKADSAGEIQLLNKSIDDSINKIKLLKGETESLNKTMTKNVSTVESLGRGLSNSYGWLRKIAYIIPGIGIGGLVLAGYEALINMIETMADSFDDNTKAIEDNNEALDRQIDKQIELDDILQSNIRDRLILSNKITESDKQRFDAYDKAEKANIDLEKARIAEAIKLAKDYEINADNLDKYTEKIMKFGRFTTEQIAKIREGVLDNKGIGGNIDKQLSVIEDFGSKIEDYYIKQGKSRQLIEENLNEEIAKIQEKAYSEFLKKQEKAYSEFLKKHKDFRKKLAKVDDTEWKNYLKIWEENWRELLRLQKQSEDDFIKSEERKWKAAEKRGEDNTILIIDNMQLEASINKDKTEQENANYQERLNNFQIQYDELGNITEASQKHLELLKQQHEQNLTDIEKEGEDKREKQQKQAVQTQIENIKQVTDFAINAYEEVLKANMEYYSHQEDLTKQNIEVQAKLASEGKANTLAEEQKRQADLERQRQQEAVKLKKAKELEVFLNAVASFSKDDPKQAFAKALTLYAETKAFEATFAEDGGLLGQINTKSNLTRKHKGGGDILVHAQTGEGILSRDNIEAMGGATGFLKFKEMLDNPMKEVPIPLNGVLFQQANNKDLEKKVDYLTEVIKNKKEVEVHWESLRERDYMVVTTIEKGIKDIVKHELKKPRLNG